jgi:glycosyltransferase involved in cell wall biosynthesis
MISLCLTTYNRTDLLFESFRQVIDDDRISEIVIVDDHSPIEVFNKIYDHTKGIPKVKLYRNEKNLDCYRNKREAVSKATNEWVIIFDSDNIMTKGYVNTLFTTTYTWDDRCIWQPSFARPHFNFTKYENKFFNKSSIIRYANDGTIQTMLNAMNYFVNRDEYLRVWDGSVDPVTSDSIFQNYNWLKAGHSIYVVPGLEYEHRVHNGSHYQNNVKRTPRGFHDSIIQKLKELR